MHDRLHRGTTAPAHWRGCCLSLGNFDGVHLGHRALLESLAAMSRRRGTKGVVMTFHPHPAEVMGKKKPRRLLPLDDRIRLLLAMGADGVWVRPFDREVASMSADMFIEEHLLAGLEIQGMVVGPDCRFGAGRKGDGRMLARYAADGGFDLEELSPLEIDGDRVSSSLVRELLIQGKVQRAAMMLGRDYRVKGEVIHGVKMGRKLGFPTANLSLFEDVLTPAEGIYVIQLRIGADPEAATALKGVVSIGRRPTFESGGKVAVEAHLFDFSDSIYGETVTMEFLRHIRGQQRFDGVAALKEAIESDIRFARAHFAATG